MFCRLCVFECNEKSCTDIFENSEKSSLTKLIANYLFLEICEDDQFSTVVCPECLQHLKQCEHFFLKVEQRQVILNEVFLSDNPSKNIKKKDSSNESDLETIHYGGDEVYLSELDSDDSYVKTPINLEFVEAQAGDENIYDGEYDADSIIDSEDNLQFNSSKRQIKVTEGKHSDYDKRVEVCSRNSPNKAEDFPTQSESSQHWKMRAEQMKDNTELIEKHADLKCDICGVISTSFENFQTHFQHEHNQKAYIRCCRLRLENKWAIANHLNSHLNPESFKCPFCSKTVSNKYYLKVHVSKYHAENKQIDITEDNLDTQIKSNMQKKRENDKFIQEHVELKCDICGFISDTCDNFKAHYQDEHKQKAYIRCCGLKFVKNCVVIQHIKSHINPAIFRCSFCLKELSNMACLKAHIRRYHTDENVLKSICGICDKRFLHSNALKIHMKVHEDSKNFNCKSCDKIFKYESALKGHRKREHENVGRSVCHLCGTEYKYKQQYDYHMAKKHNIYGRSTLKQCADCKKWFSLSNLNKHEERHKRQDVKCDKCGQILPSKIALSKHKKHHPKT